MGRASATTTLSAYAHLWPTAEDKTRAAASGMAAAVLATDLRRSESTDEPSSETAAAVETRSSHRSKGG